MALRKELVMPGIDKPDPGPESELQKKCLNYCREHGFPVFHDYSREINNPGWPDLFVFADKGRVVLVELKSGKAKLRKEQDQLRRVLNWLGHTVHIVRSYRGFLKAVMEGS